METRSAPDRLDWQDGEVSEAVVIAPTHEFMAQRQRLLARSEKLGLLREAEILTDPAFKPVQRPSLGALETDSAGNTWVGEWPRGLAPIHRWIVFDRNGHALAVAEFPANLRLMQVGLEHVVAVLRDEVDVQYVGIWKLTKPASK